MEWKKPSKELDDVLSRAIVPFGSQKKLMFGAPVYTVNGNMFAGVHEDQIFLRLPEAERKNISSRFNQVKMFEPLKGRIMKEYVVIPETIYGDRGLFREWLKRSHDFASSLPAKKAGSARGKNRSSE